MPQPSIPSNQDAVVGTLRMSGEGVTTSTFNHQRFKATVADAARVKSDAVQILDVVDSATRRLAQGRATAVTALVVTFAILTPVDQASEVVDRLVTAGPNIGPAYGTGVLSVMASPPVVVHPRPGSTGGGLSPGAKAGIAVGVILGVVGLGVAGAWVVRVRRLKRRGAQRPPSAALKAWGESSKGAHADPSASSSVVELIPFTMVNPLSGDKPLAAAQAPGPVTVRAVDA